MTSCTLCGSGIFSFGNLWTLGFGRTQDQAMSTQKDEHFKSFYHTVLKLPENPSFPFNLHDFQKIFNLLLNMFLYMFKLETCHHNF